LQVGWLGQQPREQRGHVVSARGERGELSGAKYGYGISTPAGADRSGVRVISNLLGNQAGASTADERGLWTAL